MAFHKAPLLIIAALLVVLPYCAFAQVQISLTIPGVTSASSPGGFVGGLYNFALLASGILAFGAIVWGGIKYITAAGSPSGQSEGKEWIKGAIYGLILLFGAYLILNIINPDIVSLSLPTLAPLPAPTTPPTLPPGGFGLTQEQAMAELRAAGIGVAGPIQLAGLKQNTVNELINLKASCGCDVTVTSATGGAHESGACSHANGYKVDLRSSGTGSALSNFITQNYTRLPNRSDGAPMYRAPSGAFYADERNLPGVAPHWDVTTPC